MTAATAANAAAAITSVVSTTTEYSVGALVWPTGDASRSHCGSRSRAPRYSEMTTNVTASQPIHGRRSATASAATAAITAIAGTKATPANVSLQMVAGSPIVMP